MILQRRSGSVSRRTAFTLLEVLVVVAIILVLASVATVSVMQLLKDSKGDSAKMNAVNLEKSVQMYILKNQDLPQPTDINEILKYVDGNDPSKLIDPWGSPYQIGYNDSGKPYVFCQNIDTGETIRSDAKSGPSR
ncbi:MAG: prepilin-type N-terminal cleavage/methylation domain-containing protein [Gemmataceae bacterium]|nr:prepilin-type N-terminal cleavage/methylation domain-containing protein [Gemmataceae bacterium]